MANKILIKCDDMIKLLGLNDLSSEKKEELVQEMSEIVSDRVLLKVVDKISKDEAIELNKMFEKNDMDGVSNLLDSRIPDFANILQDELNIFKEELVNNLGV